MDRVQIFAWAWLRALWSVRAVSAVLSAFGALWLVVDISSMFFEQSVPSWLRGHWYLFMIAGFMIAVWACKPQLSVSHKLNGRDVTIAIAIGDVLRFPSDIVIGSNTTFDTAISRQLIAASSVQGLFTKKHYADERQLDKDIESALNGVTPERLNGKRVGKSRRYPIGTVARLELREQTAYLLAIAHINEHGVALSSYEDLKVALAELWIHIGSRGLKKSLAMPVLGTGFSRLAQTREEVMREIVRSFIAACSERLLADQLTIVLSPRDVLANRISLTECGAFLRHHCMYSEIAAARPSHGKPVTGA